MRTCVLLTAIYPFFLFSVNVYGANIDEAIALYDSGDRASAEQQFLLLDNDPEALRYLAKLAMDEDIDAAEDYIEKAWELAPSNAEVAFVRGVVMGRQASDAIFSALRYAEKSLMSFTKAVELSPENIKFRRGLMMFHLSAPSIAGGDEKIALSQLAYIKSLSDYEGLHAELEFHLEKDDEIAFIKTALSAIKAYPSLPDFYARQGMLMQKNEQFDQAIAMFVTAAQKQDQLEYSEKYRFLSTYQIGRTAVFSENWLTQGHDALVEYLEFAPSLESLPSKEWATYRLAQILIMQNKTFDARQLLKLLLKSDDDELVSQSKSALRRLS